ncbi:succinyl-CoA synthetase subunit beta [Gammaproteobacteria bacterium]
MNLHEYQSKQLFREYGLPVPEGGAARTPEEARSAAERIGGTAWMVKAQVHAGGRGKAGGVKRATNLEEVELAARELLGKQLVTHQTGPSGLPIGTVLIEGTHTVARELYLSVLINRARERLVFMVCASGGMDIEEVAAKRPQDLLTLEVDPVVGLQPHQCRRAAFKLGLAGPQIVQLTDLMQGLYRLFLERDLSLAEVNPLAVTSSGDLLALDGKINLDENALYRQKALASLRDTGQEDPTEVAARAHDLNYVSMDGNIACMVNGAGLAMATMDLIKLHGGTPANFLDVGGTATAARVAEAFKLILSHSSVRAILVNIFGGIVRCDLIAEGIIQAVKEIGVRVPVIVRLEGTNVEIGRDLLDKSGLSLTSTSDLTEAAKQAIAASQRQ